LSSVPDAHLHQFDTRSRVIAIEQVMGFGLQCDLNLNLMPQSLLEPGAAPIGITLDAAKRWGLPASRIVIEITEGELIHDLVRFSEIINAYRASGVKLAIDDFGAGYSGLNLLAVFQPDQLKIDMALVRGIASNGPKQAIVRAIASVCLDLGIDLIAEGIETLEEFCWLTSAGLRYFQGYLFAKPGFATLPTPTYPDPFAPK
jgi:EAL domain-containing protein (putative c-di-GMP-specific phosphodiesterase class I)